MKAKPHLSESIQFATGRKDDPSSAERRRSLMGHAQNIPRHAYAKLHALMPILCVDVVVTDMEDVLLVKRATEPLADQFFIPGGRVRRAETLEEAAHRVVLEETGLTIHWPRFIGVQEFFWDTDPFGHGKGTHTVSAIYMASRRAGKIKLHRSLNDYVWEDFHEILRAGDIPRHLRRILHRAKLAKEDHADAI